MRFFVQNIYTDNEKKFQSLKKAVEFCIKEKNTCNLIHVGFWNLDYYQLGDTVETLIARCRKIIKDNNLR